MIKHYCFLSFRRHAISLFVLLSLLLGSSACVSLSLNQNPASALEPKTNNCDPSKVEVRNVHWFKDSEGAWRVVGVIHNKSTQVIGSLDTAVETRTKTDQPADQGEDVSAYPLNLLPGEEAPYTGWIDRDIPNLDHFEVEVEDCAQGEPAERSRVEIHGEQVLVDSAGYAEVTAELSNPGSQTVLVNGLMAAVYDSKGRMITAEYAEVTPRYLAPGESGSVRATLDLPPGAASKVKTQKLFMDVLVQQTNSPAAAPLPGVKLLSHYFDSLGKFHLLAELSNPSDKPIMTAVQATIKGDAGNVVDASQFATWVALDPGETLSVDLSDWGTLDHSAAMSVADASISLRVEPFLTWTSPSSAVEMTVLEQNASIDGDLAHFSGKVRNDSGKGITSGLVTAVVSRKSDAQILAVGYAHIEIEDSAAPGDILDYSIEIGLPARFDSAAVETRLFALGYQP